MATNPSLQLDDTQIRHELAPFGIYPAADQVAKIRDYVRLLLTWNRSMNLTAVTDPVEVIGRHFGESMYLASLLSVENCRLADVGSGAGFPGVAMKIAIPSIQLVLIESNKKKCAFLAEVTRSLGLAEVEILPERFEDIRPESIKANIITSRAVGNFKELIRWSGSALSPGGHLAMWLGAEESTRLARTGNWAWQLPVRILDSKGRFILVGRPMRERTTA